MLMTGVYLWSHSEPNNNTFYKSNQSSCLAWSYILVKLQCTRHMLIVDYCMNYCSLAGSNAYWACWCWCRCIAVHWLETDVQNVVRYLCVPVCSGLFSGWRGALLWSLWSLCKSHQVLSTHCKLLWCIIIIIIGMEQQMIYLVVCGLNNGTE